MRRFRVRSGLPVIICLLLVFGLCHAEANDIMGTEDDKPEITHPGRTIRVPQDEHSIQAAIDSADDGDMVLVSPGVYREMITLKDKTITVASHFLKTGDPKYIGQTILDGTIQQDKDSQKKADFVIQIAGNTGPDLRIMGFTIQNGDDGITCSGKAQILHNRFASNNDAIDYEGGGGVCQFNTFENNIDDAVDLDQATEVTIADNVIRNNQDDGIEIRFHEYSGPVLHIVIRNNVISGNGEDGIQIIDYPDRSDRVVRIQQNLIVANAMAAIGCMGDGNTKENYEGADIPERIYVINNTIANNEYGVTGGDNLVALNNIFVSNRKSALKKVDGESVAAYNLFWENGADVDGSNVDEEYSFRIDPLLDENFRPMRGSPCIDAGTAQFRWKSEMLLQLTSDAYSSVAPDLGAYESGSDS